MSSVTEKGPIDSGFDFNLGVEGFRYSDLFDPARLGELSEKFYAEVGEKEPDLHEALRRYIDGRGGWF